MQAALISYFKRYKMEVDLSGLPAPVWPAGFEPLAWRSDLLEIHANVLCQCFNGEVDAVVFPSLGNRDGCAGLMAEIARRRTFIPEATWLLVGPAGACGTVQGVRERKGMGAIQNLGILPVERGQGLGEALLLQALHGFRRWGLAHAMLEVTAQNETAIRLYRRVGFRRAKTLYKAVPTTRKDEG